MREQLILMAANPEERHEVTEINRELETRRSRLTVGPVLRPQTYLISRTRPGKDGELLGPRPPECRPNSRELFEVRRSHPIQCSDVVGDDLTWQPQPHRQVRSPAGATPIGIERTDVASSDLQFIGGFKQPGDSLFAFRTENDGAHPMKTGRNHRREQFGGTVNDVRCHAR